MKSKAETTKRRISLFSDRQSKCPSDNEDGIASDECPIIDGVEKNLSAESKLWTSAIDKRTGKEYWCNEKTRVTQWRRPSCLSTTIEERNLVAAEEQHQRDFFTAMEFNMLRSMATMIPISFNDETLAAKSNRQLDNKSEMEEVDDNEEDDDEDARVPERSLVFTRTVSGSKEVSLDPSRRISLEPQRRVASLEFNRRASLDSGRKASRKSSMTLGDLPLRPKLAAARESESSLQLSGMSMASRQQQMLVRTISTMDDSALQTFVCNQPSVRSILKKPSQTAGGRKKKASFNDDNDEVTKQSTQNRVRFGGVHIHFEQEQKPSKGIQFSDKIGHKNDPNNQSDDADNECTPKQEIGREDSIMLTSLLQQGQSRPSLNNVQQLQSFNNNSMSLRSMFPSFRKTLSNDMSLSLSGFCGNSAGSSSGNNGAVTNNSSSMGSLPEALATATNNGDGNNMLFDQSNFDFDISNEEMAAFTKLSEITNEMTTWDTDIDDNEFWSKNDSDDEYYNYGSEHDDSHDVTNNNLPVDDAVMKQLKAVDTLVISDADNTCESDQLGILKEMDEENQSSSTFDDILFTEKTDEEVTESVIQSEQPTAPLQEEIAETNTTNIDRPSLPPKSMQQRSSIQLTTPALSNRRLMRPLSAQSSLSTKNIARPIRRDKCARNSTWTSLVASATECSGLSAPDIDATIYCVCGMFRAQLVQTDRIDKELFATTVSYKCSENDDTSGSHDVLLEYNMQYSVFDDEIIRAPKSKSKTKALLSKLSSSFTQLEKQFTASFSKLDAFGENSDDIVNDVPSLEEIARFYREAFQHTKMDGDCIIVSLIYFERIIQQTSGVVRPRVSNWHTILFSAMMLARRVSDDIVSAWKDDFVFCIYPTDSGNIDGSGHHIDKPTKQKKMKHYDSIHFSSDRVQELDDAIILALGNQIKVTTGEYAKYYFVLRSMLIKSGLGSDDLTQMRTLDIDGARRLQHLSAQYEQKTAGRVNSSMISTEAAT